MSGDEGLDVAGESHAQEYRSFTRSGGGDGDGFRGGFQHVYARHHHRDLRFRRGDGQEIGGFPPKEPADTRQPQRQRHHQTEDRDEASYAVPNRHQTPRVDKKNQDCDIYSTGLGKKGRLYIRIFVVRKWSIGPFAV